MITLFYGSEREKVLAAFAAYESEKNYQLDVPRTIYGVNFSHEYQTLFDPVKIYDLIYADHYSLFMQDCLNYYGNQTKDKDWDKKEKESNFLLIIKRSIRLHGLDVDFYISSPFFSDFNSAIKKYMTAKIECKKVNGHTVGDYVLLRTNEKSQIVLD